MESWQKCDSHSNNGIILTGIISTEFGTSACNNLMFSAEIISTEFDTLKWYSKITHKSTAMDEEDSTVGASGRGFW